MLPAARPLMLGGAVAARRTALAALLPAGYTRLLLPAYRRKPTARAAAVRLHVRRRDRRRAVRRGDADRRERRLDAALLRRRRARRALARAAGDGSAQSHAGALAVCSRDYGCFTAQNLFLERGEAALPVSPRVTPVRRLHLGAAARAGLAFAADAGRVRGRRGRRRADRDPSPRTRARRIVSFGQGCEGEPLLR